MTTSASDAERPSSARGSYKISGNSLMIAFDSERSPWDHVERKVYEWQFSVSTSPPDADDDPYDTRVHVGRGSVLVVELHNGRDPMDALDEHSADGETIGATIFDSDGDLDQEFDDLIEPLGDRVLILDRVEIDPEFRGEGLGPLIAGMAITTLSGGAVAAVCCPAPIGRPLDPDGQPRDFQPGEREAVVAKLSKVWATLGFEHFRDGVHYISMSHTRFSNSFKKVLEDHGLA